MGTITAFLKGAMLGAGAVYFLDPRLGNRRRALVADHFRRLSRRTGCVIDAGVRDLGNRTRGAVHDVGSFVGRGKWPTSPQRQAKSSGECGCGLSPGARLIAGGVGTALMANCLTRRTPSAVLLGTLGFGMFAKAVDAGPRGVQVEKTFDVDSSPDKVFDFFTHPRNWLHVSDIVTSVEVFDDGRFAKTLLIAGIPLRFEERFVRCKEGCLIETESEPTSVMKFCKHLTMEEIENGGTRVRMSFHYHPPGGALGHAIASAFGIDAKTVLTDLLMRAKYFIETGREPHDAMSRQRSQRHGQRLRSGNGSQRGEVGSQMHGAGAPEEDVGRPGVIGFEESTPWPTSEAAVSPEVPGEHFPRSMD